MFDRLLRSFICGRFKHLQHLLQTVNVAKKSSRGKKLQLFALNRSKDDIKHEMDTKMDTKFQGKNILVNYKPKKKML